MSNIPRSFVILVLPTGTYPSCVAGRFAGDAWMKSAEKFLEIIGDSFDVITFDDMKRYTEHKANICFPRQDQWDDLPEEHKAFCIAAYVEYGLEVKHYEQNVDYDHDETH